MRVFLDWDGICIQTERAKALRWLLAVTALAGSDADVNRDLLMQVSMGSRNALDAVRAWVATHADELKQAEGFAGGTRRQYGTRVLEAFAPGGDIEELFRMAETVRVRLIEEFSEPMAGNLAGFRLLRDTLRNSCWCENPVGLVTQTESSMLLNQLARAGFWGEHEEWIREAFGPYYIGRGFPFAECAGDYPRTWPALPASDYKARAYRVLLRKLRVPPAEVVSFEDTADGVRASLGAGIACIAVRFPGSRHDLQMANVVLDGEVVRYLTPEVLDAFASGQPSDVFALLKS